MARGNGIRTEWWPGCSMFSNGIVECTPLNFKLYTMKLPLAYFFSWNNTNNIIFHNQLCTTLGPFNCKTKLIWFVTELILNCLCPRTYSEVPMDLLWHTPYLNSLSGIATYRLPEGCRRLTMALSCSRLNFYVIPYIKLRITFVPSAPGKPLINQIHNTSADLMVQFQIVYFYFVRRLFLVRHILLV